MGDEFEFINCSIKFIKKNRTQFMFNPLSTILMAAWMPPDRLGYMDVSSNDQKIFVTFHL